MPDASTLKQQLQTARQQELIQAVRDTYPEAHELHVEVIRDENNTGYYQPDAWWVRDEHGNDIGTFEEYDDDDFPFHQELVDYIDDLHVRETFTLQVT